MLRRLGRWLKSYRVYRLEQDYLRRTDIRGLMYDSVYVRLHREGWLLIRAGYAWNGCSPKYDVLGMVLGTPEGTVNARGVPRTYYPSLVHDAFYQMSSHLPRLRRKDVDRLFLDMLRQEGFGAALLYYWVVRLFGRTAWGGANDSCGESLYRDRKN